MGFSDDKPTSYWGTSIDGNLQGQHLELPLRHGRQQRQRQRPLAAVCSAIGRGREPQGCGTWGDLTINHGLLMGF